MIKCLIEDNKEEDCNIVVIGKGEDILNQSVLLIECIAEETKFRFSSQAAVEYLEYVISFLIDDLKEDYGKIFKHI